MHTIVKYIDNINDFIGKWLSPIPIVVIVLVCYEIFQRYIMDNPTTWVIPLSSYLIGIYFVIAGPYSYRHDSHVNMDIVYSRVSLRKRAVLDLVTSLVLFAFIIVLLWVGADITWRSVKTQERLLGLWTPLLWPFKIWVPVAAFLLLLQGIAKFIRNIHIAIGKEINK